MGVRLRLAVAEKGMTQTALATAANAQRPLSGRWLVGWCGGWLWRRLFPVVAGR